MDVCYLKNLESAPQYLKYKGRVVFRADIVKDDSGSHAVFAEQGSTASQMTTAKVLDVKSRRCSIREKPGQNGRGTHLIEHSNSECRDIWIRLPKHKWPKSWSSMEDPLVPLERNLCGHLLAVLLWARQFEKVLLVHCWEKFRIGNVCSLSEKMDYSYQCMRTI